MRMNKMHAKRATNVTLTEALLEEAKALDINVSRAAEQGLAQAIAEKHAERWRVQNKAALESSNAYVEKFGLPLARYRKF
jgi:antitoxin CcdA